MGGKPGEVAVRQGRGILGTPHLYSKGGTPISLLPLSESLRTPDLRLGRCRSGQRVLPLTSALSSVLPRLGDFLGFPVSPPWGTFLLGSPVCRASCQWLDAAGGAGTVSGFLETAQSSSLAPAPNPPISLIACQACKGGPAESGWEQDLLACPHWPSADPYDYGGHYLGRQ